MVETGGWPLVVSEDELWRANLVARESTGIDVDHTGSSGLAGLLHLLETAPADETDALGREHVAVVFSGVRRS